jgi:DNA-binding transcriptional MerR regulator
MLGCMETLLPIGRFARRAGLTVGALRHYHAHGLLEPARIDPVTGYRSYAADQLEDARLIANLRALNLGLPEVRQVLASDPVERRRRLGAHRSRLMAQLARTQRQIHWLNRAIDHEEPIMTTTAPASVDAATHRQLAVDLFNHVWTLLEMPDRTPAQNDEMLHAAHASRHHWGVVGTPENRGRGEWQCSRVYAILGRAEPALWHGRRYLALCEEHGIADWDLAFAHEAIARALAVAGDREGARAEVARARELAADIAEDEDRELVLSDLQSIEIHDGR